MKSIVLRLRRKRTVKVRLPDLFTLVVLGTDTVYVYKNGELIPLDPGHGDQAHLDTPNYTVDLVTTWVGDGRDVGAGARPW